MTWKKSKVSPKKMQSNQIHYQKMEKVQPWKVSRVKLRTDATCHFKVQSYFIRQHPVNNKYYNCIHSGYQKIDAN